MQTRLSLEGSRVDKGHFLIVLEQLPYQGWKIWQNISPLSGSSVRLIPPTSWWRRTTQKLFRFPDREVFCPITAVHAHFCQNLPRTHSHLQAAIDLGLDRNVTEEIKRASDGVWGHDPELRSKIIHALLPPW